MLSRLNFTNNYGIKSTPRELAINQSWPTFVYNINFVLEYGSFGSLCCLYQTLRINTWSEMSLVGPGLNAP